MCKIFFVYAQYIYIYIYIQFDDTERYEFRRTHNCPSIGRWQGKLAHRVSYKRIRVHLGKMNYSLRSSALRSLLKRLCDQTQITIRGEKFDSGFREMFCCDRVTPPIHSALL